jgi:outer membrane protein TolC
MKNKIIVLFIVAVNLFAQQSRLTLEESVEIGLKNSRLIKISESQVRSADSKVTEFTSQMLPRLGLSAGYTYMNLNDPTELGIGSVPIKVVNPFSAYGLQLSIQQPIFTGFQLSSSRSVAKYNHLAVSTDHLQNINNKALEIHFTFWNLFKAEKSAKLIEENLASLKEHLQQTNEFLNNGLVTINDYLKLKVQVSNMELELIDAKNRTELARAAFNKSLGLKLAEQTSIATDLLVLQQPAAQYSDLLSEALINRQELTSLEYRIKAGEEQITAVNSDWWPKLYASGNFFLYNLNAQTFSIDNQKLQLWFVGLSLNWDIWNWGNTSSKSDQAKQSVIQRKESLELLKEQIELEVYNNYLTLNSEKEKIKISKLTVESAEENYRMTKDKYQSQLATSNDLIDAEVELLDAKTKLAIAQADFQLAQARLELAIGRRIY